MILDEKANLHYYRGLSPSIAAGIDFLLASKLESLEHGRIDIAGDQTFALVQSYSTVPGAEKLFESHRNYVDIQYLVSGEEIIYWSPLTSLKVKQAYDAQKDVELYYNREAMPLTLGKGWFALLFPPDAHKPGCMVNDATTVKKIVVKCRV